MKKKVQAVVPAAAFILVLTIAVDMAAAPRFGNSFWSQLTKSAREYAVRLFGRMSPPLPEPEPEPETRTTTQPLEVPNQPSR